MILRRVLAHITNGCEASMTLVELNHSAARERTARLTGAPSS